MNTPASYQVMQELINGPLMLLNIYLVVVFIGNANTRSPLRSWKLWRTDPTVRAAIALGTYFLGAAILRIWEWLFSFLRNMNIQFDWPSLDHLEWIVQRSWPMLVLGGTATYVGGLCIVRVFNPHSRGRWLQYVVVAVSVLVPFGWHAYWNGVPW